jgi:hypothetical protein
MSDVLKLFEGLTPDQAKRLRARILPTLSEIRREIIQEAVKAQEAKQAEGEIKTRVNEQKNEEK